MACETRAAGWYRDPEALKQEREQHGTFLAIAKAHGGDATTYSQWWVKHGLPKIPRGAKPPAAQAAVQQADVSEEEILRQRLEEYERDFTQRRKREVFEERLIRAIQAACQAKEPSYKPPPKNTKGGKEAHEFVLLWSDTHAAEVVSREETNGLNEYDWDTMLKRHNRITQSVASFAEHRGYPINALHVLALGDMLSGNLHDELAETNEMPLAEATVQAGLDFAEWLEQFVQFFPRVTFAGIVGNHPRAHRKPRAKQKFDNADWTMFQVMRQRLSKTAIRFEIPKAPKWPVEVCGRRILMFHGDGIRSTMPGVPWGGVMRRVAALQNEYAGAGLPIDHFACGHFHQANVVQGGRVLMNGSVKGVDEFSLHAFGGGDSPRQLLLTFHPRRGLTDVSVIDL